MNGGGAGASLASEVRAGPSKELTLKVDLKGQREVPRCPGQAESRYKGGEIGMVEEQKEGWWGWTGGETGRK